MPAGEEALVFLEDSHDVGQAVMGAGASDGNEYGPGKVVFVTKQKGFGWWLSCLSRRLNLQETKLDN